MLTVQQDPGWIHCFLSYRIFIWAYVWHMVWLYLLIDTAHSIWITDSDLTLCWLLREIQTIYNSHSLWHKRTLGKGANWRVINSLNLFLIKPHSYGVFTYTVIEDNLYDSVFLMSNNTFFLCIIVHSSTVRFLYIIVSPVRKLEWRTWRACWNTTIKLNSKW